MKELIENFYKAFAERDAEKMVACYHPEVTFDDPAFGTLHGKDAMDMWRMLCKSAKDLEITYSGIEADHEKGMAFWEAKYVFSRTGKTVHNKILAKFRFKDGLIISHIDNFNLQKWAAQAMGWKGKLLGGTEFFKSKIRQTTAHSLKKFQNAQ